MTSPATAADAAAVGWSLTTVKLGTQELAAIRLPDGRFVQPPELASYGGLFQALADWERLVPALRNADPAGLEPLQGATCVAPLRFPRKLLCVGANYRDHIAEMSPDIDTSGWSPFFFSVPPTTTVIGTGESVLIPTDPAYSIDWEAELAVVIGVGGRDITREDARSHVAGYACFNDVTARGLLRRADAFTETFRWDWAGSKSLDTFCPIGPITPAWMVDDPNDLSIRCLVNGKVKQDGSTRNFINNVDAVIAAASRTWTLEPGDVIATGTPAGVGFPHGERLVDGDEVRVEITGLVPLSNPIIARVEAKSLAGAR